MNSSSFKTAPKLPTYTYKDLDATKEIRVLVVHAGSGETPISTTLRNTSLDNIEPYETISYVWGDPTARGILSIDEQELHVPLSSQNAIRRMRTDTDRVLWIDSVCINQANEKEKTDQIPLMGAVYRKAKQNLVWLGESKSSTAAAVEAIYAVWEDLLAETNNLDTFFETTFEQEHKFKGWSSEHRHCPHNIGALVEFFANPWFERIWCVQEVALAESSIVLCGDYQIPLLLILRVAKWCWHKARFLIGEDEELFQKLYPWGTAGLFKNQSILISLVDPELGELRRARPGKPSLTLYQLFDYSTEFAATRVHDHLYGTLGLAAAMSDLQLSTLLRPDYSRPIALVARDAAIASIIEIDGLAMLNQVFHHSNDEDEKVRFPSWAPRPHLRWSRTLHATPLSLHKYTQYPDDGQSSGIARKILAKSPDMLCLYGVLMDPIEETTDVFTEAVLADIDAMTDLISSINSWMTPTDMEDHDSQIRWVNGLSRTLIAADRSDEVDETREVFLAWALAIKKFAPAQFGVFWTNDPTAMQELDKLRQYNARMVNFCTNRRFFRTRHGQFGLGPRGLDKGDFVVAVRSYPLPVILRPNGECQMVVTSRGNDIEVQHRWFRTFGQPEEFRFIGDGYVNGAMYGEAVRLQLQGKREDRVFEVR